MQWDTQWLCGWAILASRDDSVRDTNAKMIETFPGEKVEYQSIDTVHKEGIVDDSVDFFHSLQPPGFPLHTLTLKQEPYLRFQEIYITRNYALGHDSQSYQWG